jgi:uncharacterized protein YukE
MSSFEVNPAAMTSAEQDLANFTQKMVTEMNALETETEAKLATWVDEASKMAYKAAKRKWDTALDEMSIALKGSSAALGDMGQTYDAGRRSVAGLWG